MPPNIPRKAGQGENRETALVRRGKAEGLGTAQGISYLLGGASAALEEPQLTLTLPQLCFRSMWVSAHSFWFNQNSHAGPGEKLTLRGEPVQ